MSDWESEARYYSSCTFHTGSRYTSAVKKKSQPRGWGGSLHFSTVSPQWSEMAWRASLAFNLHRPHCHWGSNTVICCHCSPSLISTEVCSRSSNWESHPSDGDGKCVDLNVGDAGVPSSSSVLFPPAEGLRVCAPPACQVCREQRQELVFQSRQLKSARYRRVISSSWLFNFFPKKQILAFILGYRNSLFPFTFNNL